MTSVVTQDSVEGPAGMIAEQFFTNGLDSVAYLGVDNPTTFDLDAHRMIIAQVEKIFNCAVKSEFKSEGYWSFQLSASSGLDAPVGKSATDKINPVELSEALAKARLSERNGKKIPRPMNRWMLWSSPRRRGYQAKYPELTNQQVSTRMAEDYKKLSPEETNFLKKEADQAALIHSIMYPGYKFSPRKPGEKRRRQRRAVLGAAAAPNPPPVPNAPLPQALTQPMVFNTAVPQPILPAQSMNQQNAGPPDGVELADMTTQGTWTPEDTQQPWRTAEVKRMAGLDEEFSDRYGLQEAMPANPDDDEEFMRSLANNLEAEIARMATSDNLFEWEGPDMFSNDTGNAALGGNQFDFGH